MDMGLDKIMRAKKKPGKPGTHLHNVLNELRDGEWKKISEIKTAPRMARSLQQWLWFKEARDKGYFDYRLEKGRGRGTGFYRIGNYGFTLLKFWQVEEKFRMIEIE